MTSALPISPSDYEVLLRRDLTTFTERSFAELNPESTFIPSPYLEVLATKLEQCRRGELRRLIVNLAPRSLKSHTVSVAFAAWLLGHNPATQIICASYGQELADKHARDCRTLMTGPFYRKTFPGTALSAKKQSVNEFLTTRHGCRLSTSVGGVLTGRGADVIIIDDPLKPDDAMSESRRKAVNDWFDNSLLSRLNDKNKGVIIIVMQRVHMDDLVGHALEQGGWEVLSFPAIAEVDESFEVESFYGKHVYRRCAGDVLYPDRESLETLSGIRQSIGEFNFSAQYQQRPIPLEGAIVKSSWLRFYEPNELPKEFTYVIQRWDTANKAGELNDFSVCTTWGVWEKRFFLLDVFRARLEFPALKRKVKELSRLFDATGILIEDKASGTQLIQELKSDGMYTIKGCIPPPGADKVMRLVMQTIAFENGMVVLPRKASWLPDYLNELAAFPGGKHDDQVDSTSQALEYLYETVRRPSIYDLL
jgi:predicted phage terminase large subunit-like protein